MADIGKAYGFFDCRASKQEIESEIPTIRTLTQAPSTLELLLIEGVENLKGDAELIPVIKQAKADGMRYVLEATLPNSTNKKAADETSAILNQAYQSPLFNEGEEFRGGIVYKENGEFVFSE